MSLAHYIMPLRESEIPSWALTDPLKHFQVHPWILWKACATLCNPPFYILEEKNPGKIHLTPVLTQMHMADFY